MELLKFRVLNYRSYNDSGWIDVRDLTTFIGASEAGKSNLLTALWKLNPAARSGKVKPELDLPKKIYDNYIEAEEKPVFVEAVFSMDDRSTGLVRDNFPNMPFFDKVFVRRDLNGVMTISAGEAYEEGERTQMITQLLSPVLPKFIYSSNYGNLDSNVYLPSILRRFNRFGYNAASKTMSRSLRIILSYIGISSTRLLREIRKLKDDKTIKKIYAADIKMAIEDKPDYYLPLLEDGCKRLSADFSRFWKQSQVDIQLEFTEKELKFYIVNESGCKIDLTSQSVAFQWFLSFFLIYTVEIHNLYVNTILLFDENGMCITNEMQKDLARFFEEMAKSNQILIASSNPASIGSASLEKARVVYRNQVGESAVANNLDLKPENTLSMLPLFQSFGMKLGQMKYAACVPVIVADESDQYYLDMVKAYLSAGGWMYQVKEVAFIPAGLDAIESVAGLFVNEYHALPYCILPSTEEGEAAAKRLREGIYANSKYRIKTLRSYAGKNRTAEDLAPLSWVKKSALTYIQGIVPGIQLKRGPLIAQIETFAEQNNLTLPADYRIQIAQRVKFYEVKTYPKVRMSRFRFRRWRRLFKFLKKYNSIWMK